MIWKIWRKSKTIRVVFILTITIVAVLVFLSPILWMFFNIDDSGYDYISEIRIDRDRQVKKYASSGSGKISDPYILDQLDFVGDKTIGLRIDSISKYVILQDIQFKGEELGLSLGYLEPGLISVRNCTFLNCDMDVYRCDLVTITNNTFLDNKIGISFVNSEKNVITNNHFDSGGLHFERYYHVIEEVETFTVSNNFLGGKLILFLKNEENITISNDYSQIFLLHCANVLVENLVLNCTSQAILIANSKNCTIKNSFASSYVGTVYITKSPEISIVNCTLTHLKWKRREISDSILINESPYFVLRNSSISNCNGSAVMVYDSDNSLFEFNIITNSKAMGIEINHSNSCQVIYNQIEDSYYTGVSLYKTRNCFVHHNNFFNNSWQYHKSEGRDMGGSNNFWYSPSLHEGNYWSSLGISTYYTINIDEAVYDSYPFLTPIDIFG